MSVRKNEEIMMKKQINEKSQVFRVFLKLPIWIKLLLVISIITLLINGGIWLINSVGIYILGKNDNHSCLSSFESKYHDFQIKIPKCWTPPWITPYESRGGIHGDIYKILEYIQGDFPHATLEISRIELEKSNLLHFLELENKNILEIPGSTIISVSLYDTKRYQGNLISYNISNAGFRNMDRNCYDWITYIEPYSYSISLCDSSTERDVKNGLFFEIIESFSIFPK